MKKNTEKKRKKNGVVFIIWQNVIYCGNKCTRKRYKIECVFLVELVHLRKIRFLFVHFDCCADFNVGIMCLCSIHSQQTENSYLSFPLLLVGIRCSQV